MKDTFFASKHAFNIFFVQWVTRHWISWLVAYMIYDMGLRSNLGLAGNQLSMFYLFVHLMALKPKGLLEVYYWPSKLVNDITGQLNWRTCFEYLVCMRGSSLVSVYTSSLIFTQQFFMVTIRAMLCYIIQYLALLTIRQAITERSCSEKGYKWWSSQ